MGRNAAPFGTNDQRRVSGTGKRRQSPLRREKMKKFLEGGREGSCGGLFSGERQGKEEYIDRLPGNSVLKHRVALSLKEVSKEKKGRGKEGGLGKRITRATSKKVKTQTNGGTARKPSYVRKEGRENRGNRAYTKSRAFYEERKLVSSLWRGCVIELAADLTVGKAFK